MKHMKRFMALFAALALVFAMAVPAWAESGTATSNRGTITIDNAVKDTTYKIYRIFDLESYDTSKEAYSYKLNSAWADFASYTATIDGSNVSASEFFTVDSATGYIKWADAKKDEGAAFAKLAKAFADEKKPAVVKEDTASGSTVTFSDLDLGYYLVYSSLGALCSLNTTAPTVTIKEKNGSSIITKQVYDNESESFKKENSAGIGDYVKFEIDVTVSDGQPKDYVVHDKMSEGLTFVNEGSHALEVKVNGATSTAYTLRTKNVGTLADTDCTFEVAFNNNTDGSSVLQPNDTVKITYWAQVNEKAKIGSAEGNTNEAQLEYSHKPRTNWDQTKTYVWEIGIYKYTLKNNTKTPLKDAQFVFYRGNGDDKEYAQITNNKITGWTRIESEATTLTTPDGGNLTITGLDVGTYYLKETVAPNGYNKLDNPIKVEIRKNGVEVDNVAITGTTVEVENNAGTTLPSTGGIGTTIFYVIGGGLMVAAAVLLIAKKRMENK